MVVGFCSPVFSELNGDRRCWVAGSEFYTTAVDWSGTMGREEVLVKAKHKRVQQRLLTCSVCWVCEK